MFHPRKYQIIVILLSVVNQNDEENNEHLHITSSLVHFMVLLSTYRIMMILTFLRFTYEQVIIVLMLYLTNYFISMYGMYDYHYIIQSVK